MKKSQFHTALGLLAVLLLTVFSACDKEQILNSDPTINLETPDLLQISTDISTDLQVENGVLIFQNLEDYRTTLLGLNRSDVLEQLLWEEGLGFHSLQRLFNDLMEAEVEKGALTHSQKYLEALSSGLILEHEFGYDLNIFNPTYAPILNPQGIVKVGNSIFQFTTNALKIWENGNVQQLELLLLATDPTTEIQIIPMESGIGTVNVRSPYIWTDQCQQENGLETRMILSGMFYSDFYKPDDTPEVIFLKYYINLKSQFKDDQGNWQYDTNAEIVLSGDSHSYFEVSDGNNIYGKDYFQDYLVLGNGGNYFLIADESGYHTMQSPYFFTQPAQLINCEWMAKSKMSTGENFQCGISK